MEGKVPSKENNHTLKLLGSMVRTNLLSEMVKDKGIYAQATQGAATVCDMGLIDVGKALNPSMYAGKKA